MGQQIIIMNLRVHWPNERASDDCKNGECHRNFQATDLYSSRTVTKRPRFIQISCREVFDGTLLFYSYKMGWISNQRLGIGTDRAGPGRVAGYRWRSVESPCLYSVDWLTWPNTTIHLEGDFYHAPHNHSQFTKKCYNSLQNHKPSHLKNDISINMNMSVPWSFHWPGDPVCTQQPQQVELRVGLALALFSLRRKKGITKCR